jgi:glycosyltransferase involved in cell wall biosynthesis
MKPLVSSPTPPYDTGMTPTLSFIIPVWNRAHCVQATVESVLAQDHYKKVELILWDDASTDNSLEIMQSFKDERVKLGKNKTNQGVNITRNRAAAQAQGEWLVMLDSDDQLLPSGLDLILKDIEHLPKTTGVVFYGTRDSKSGKLKSFSDTKNGLISYQDYLIGKRMHGEFLPVVRRSVFEKIGGYDETLFAFEGYFWSQVARHFDVQVHNEPVRLYGYADDHRLSQILFDLDKLPQRIHSYELFLKTFGADLKRLAPAKHDATQWRLAVFKAAQGQGKAARQILRHDLTRGSLKSTMTQVMTRFGAGPFRLGLKLLGRLS